MSQSSCAHERELAQVQEGQELEQLVRVVVLMKIFIQRPKEETCIILYLLDNSNI